MSLIQAIILGALQGLTEFLPVSSSGHLVIFSYILSAKAAPLYFDVFVHAGSLIALIIFFRQELLEILKSTVSILKSLKITSETDRLIINLLIGTIPVAAVGFFFNDLFEKLFLSPITAVRMLFVTAILLILSEYLSKKRTKSEPLNPWKALFIGFFQALALVPGISRSGATIAAGMFTGLSREEAAKFSFLLAIPALSGAFLFKATHALYESFDILVSLAGLLVSFIVSFFAIVVLINFVRRHSLMIFAIYCTLLAIFGSFVVK